MKGPTCPTCGGPLHEVLYPGGALNREQWASVRAGDWWCATCPDNGRGRSGAYWWAHELQAIADLRAAVDAWALVPDPVRTWLRRPGGR